MKLWRKFTALFRRNQREADMAAEMQAHLDLQAGAHERAGMTAEAARRAARCGFGGVEQVKERAREVRGILWLEQLAQDVRYAFRQLARSPGYAAVVVLTLALGIGATTAIYSVVDAVLLHPVPGPHSDRIVQIGQWLRYPNSPEPARVGLMQPVKEMIESQADFFAETSWCDEMQFSREGADFSTTVFGSAVPVNFFRFLNVRPVLGRSFAEDEAVAIVSGVPERDTSILVSEAWWKSEFGGDPGVLGRAIDLGGRRFTVIGVMPDYFRYPYSGQFWLPASELRAKPGSLEGGNLLFLARLKPEVPPERLSVLLETAKQRMLQEHSENSLIGSVFRQWSGGQLWALPLHEAIQASYSREYDTMRRMLYGFFGAMGFVLAIVCANIANLTLARTERRQHELAIRAALGAGRTRLMRQLLTESLLLAAIGGLAGLVVTYWGMRLLAAYNTMPQLRPVALNGFVLLTALAASLATGLIFGLLPAWRAGRARVTETLSQGAAGATTGPRGARYRHALVVLEIALALVLLAGAGLTIQSVVKLLRVDPGYDPANLVRLQVRPTGPGSGEIEVRNAEFRRVHELVATLPGVTAVGIFMDQFAPRKIAIPNRSEPVLAHGSYVGWGDSDFFRVARAPVLAGRLFDSREVGAGSRAVVVNETLAQLCWPDRSAVGQRFRAIELQGAPEFEVVGVVRDVRLHDFTEKVRPSYYRPYTEAQTVGLLDFFMVRVERDPAALMPAIRDALKNGGQKLRAPSIAIVARALYDRTQSQRTFRNYLIAFAGVGLVLAALGIYGVLAYSVARRTREIGIRMAIGADRAHVIRMVMRDGGRLVTTGVGVGLLAAFWLTTLLEKQLFATSPRDPLVLGIVAAVLSAIALLACWLPARRAAKVNPMVALRSE